MLTDKASTLEPALHLTLFQEAWVTVGSWTLRLHTCALSCSWVICIPLPLRFKGTLVVSHGLGCLHVLESTGTYVSLNDFYSDCCSLGNALLKGKTNSLLEQQRGRG